MAKRKGNFHISDAMSKQGRPTSSGLLGNNPYSGYQESEMNGRDMPTPMLKVTVRNMRYPVTPQDIYQVFSTQAQINRMTTFHDDGCFIAFIQYPDVRMAQSVKMATDGQDLYTNSCTLSVEYSRLEMNIYVEDDMNPNMGAGMGMGDARRAPPSDPNCMIKIGNLNPDCATVRGLCVLFGTYGDILRIKLMSNKKKAFLEYAAPLQAEYACYHLNKLQVWGRTVSVNPAPSQYIGMAPPGSIEAEFTRDFTNFEDHGKFAKREINFEIRPSANLFVANIHPTATEEEVIDFFTSCGSPPKNVRLMKKEKVLCFVEMESVEKGVEGVMKMHNQHFKERLLFVTFCK